MMRSLMPVLFSMAMSASGVRVQISDERLSTSAEAKGRSELFANVLFHFNRLKQKGNVHISDAGDISLTKLDNFIPFEGCPSQFMEAGGPNACLEAGKATIVKVGEDHVEDTLQDLKDMLSIVGVKAITIVGKAGGPGRTEGGSMYKKAWTPGWERVAEARAQTILKGINPEGNPVVHTSGQLSEKVGIEIKVRTYLKLSVLSALTPTGDEAGEFAEMTGDEAAALAGKAGVETVASGLQAAIVEAKAVLAHGNIELKEDETVRLAKFAENTVPFENCAAKRSSLVDDMTKCILGTAPGARVVDAEVTKANQAMDDIGKLGDLLGVQHLAIVGSTEPFQRVASVAEKTIVKRLAAARALSLVAMLKNGSGGDTAEQLPVLEKKLQDCSKSDVKTATRLCKDVTEEQGSRVTIRMSTLFNPGAL